MLSNRTPMDDLLGITTHATEFLFAESAATIVADASGEGFADAPPEAANYRPADVEGIACWNCAHFQKTGIGDDNWPVGLCHLWEAKVEGEATCDKWTADATMGVWPRHMTEEEEGPEYPGEEYSGESSHLVEVFFSDDGDVEMSEADGLVTKAILRTGEWKKTPSSQGVIRKPLRVIRDGVSSAKDRVIALSEVVENFNAGAYPNVPIPLTDEENKDHKNLLRLNTGWIKKLWIKDEDGKPSKLMAGMQFTEPDARAKVGRGTYPDVSSGIYFGIERPDGQKFNVGLNHVVITHKPFMDGLGPFGVTASDDERPAEIESLVLADGETDTPSVDWDPELTFTARMNKVQDAVTGMLEIPEVKGEANTYRVKDLMGDNRALVFSEAAEQEWVVEFSLEEDGGVVVKPTEDWQSREIEASQEDEQPDGPAVAPETVVSNETPLQQAHRRRALRTRVQTDSEGGVRQMGKVKTRDISEVDFSDAEDAKAYAVELSEANKELGKTTSEGELETRITELKELGFSEMPGFLSEYRDIYLSDDGGPAMVLLSTDDDGNEIGKKALSGIELADRLIAAIPTDKEGKILLSGQHLNTGTSVPPPVEEEIEGLDNSPEKVEERTQAQAESIGLDLGGKEE